MDNKEAKAWFESLSAEDAATLIKTLSGIDTNTVRDIRTPVPAPDLRVYYHIRVGQFETVVDGRDCNSSDNALEYVTKNRTQAWYFADDGIDESVPLTTKWTHDQYITWLRR